MIHVFDTAVLNTLRKMLAAIYLHPDVDEYIRNIILASRSDVDVVAMTCFNAYKYLTIASKIRAIITLPSIVASRSSSSASLTNNHFAARNQYSHLYVTPDNVQSVAVQVLRHRLSLLHQEEFAPEQLKDILQKVSPDDILTSILVNKVLPPF